MGLFGGNDDVKITYLETLNHELMAIHMSFLNKERYMMGRLTADEYKAYLDAMYENKSKQLNTLSNLIGFRINNGGRNNG